MTWVEGCAVSALEEGEGWCLRLSGRAPIAIWNYAGRIFATADTCTHSQASLSEDGELEGDVIVCGLHMARYDVRTGKALELPAEADLETLPTKVDEGTVYVEVE